MSTLTESDWTSTRDGLPPSDLVVVAMDSSGRVTELGYTRSGEWVYPDGSQYRGFYPVFWKVKP